MMTVEAADQTAAQVKLAQQLGIGLADLKFVKAQVKKFSFEVLNCPAIIDVEVTRDGMRAYIRRIGLPVGSNAPRLDTQFIVDQLAKYGVNAGVKRETITVELNKILRTPGYDDLTPLNIVAAEGVPPIAGSTGRPKWMIDLKLFEKNIPLYAKRGEVLAKAPHATVPRDGQKVTGEIIPAQVDEQFKLNTGAGIKVVKEATEIVYTAATFGRLFYDQGIRLRLDSKVIDLDQGMSAGVEIGKTTITGLPIKGEDLLDMAKDQRVVFGFLSPEEVNTQIQNEKKWPAIIRIAKGKLPVDGTHGNVKLPYKETTSTRVIDQQKAKANVVFPGEVVAVIEPPKDPVPGQTVFGEVLRGKPCDDFPIYPGKNINRERSDANTVFKSATYGVVKQDKDRIWVQNNLTVSADKMEVTLDLFPQRQLSVQDFLNLLREADILLQPNKEELEKQLQETFQKSERIEKFSVVKGKLPQLGADAKLVYRFNPEIFKEKGVFQKKVEAQLFAVPGDLMLTKILPLSAKDGINVFREKIPVPPGANPKDVDVKSGKGVSVKEVGEEGNPQNPLRLEYRAAVMGVVSWKDRVLDVKSSLQFDPAEKFVTANFAFRSDFGTPVTLDILKKIAESESIRVDLETVEIQKILGQQRPPDGSLLTATIARAVEPKHGSNASMTYYVDYDGQTVESFFGKRSAKLQPPKYCDCVLPKDVLATKKGAALGEDGKTVFGRRIPADRGRDEPWFYGEGIDRSPDGSQIYCNAKSPGFAFIEDGRLVIRSTVKVSKDKMSATVSLYPSKNPRFPLREDKILSMLAESGVRFGVNRELLKSTIQKVIESGEPVLDILIAEGKVPTKGQDGSYVLAIDVGATVGEIRADGSMDFRDRNIFLSVRKGQLLLIRRPPLQGEDGTNVLGESLPSLYGAEAKLTPKDGVQITPNGLEYRATRDGIVELKNREIRVIEGLLVPDDVSYKTGHIDAGASDLFIRGNVLPDFRVKSDGDISIHKVAEACTVIGASHLSIRGGVIGRERALVTCGKDMDTLYISGGATVEVRGNLTVGTEVLSSQIRVAGNLTCTEGAGTISGGEIWVFGNTKVRTLGAPASEIQTVVHLGENFFDRRDAEAKIADLKLNEDIAALEEQIKVIAREIAEGFETKDGNALKGHELQEQYQVRIREKQELQSKLEGFLRTKAEILSRIGVNPEAILVATEMIYPGVAIIHKHVTWILKEPQKGVEVRWNSPTSNLISKRL